MIRHFSAPKGKVIFQPGQDCPGFVLLSKGTIRVTLTGASGREVVLYRVRPGEVCLQTFSCLVDGHAYGAEGVAETDLDGELIPADHFNARLADDSAFRSRILHSVATRFSEYQQLIEEVALTGFDGTLAQQSIETQSLMRECLFGGTAVTFAGAFALSLGIRLRKSEVEAAQRQLARAAM